MFDQNKKSSNQLSHKISSFWWGFFLGITTVGIGSFFFGTKKGRKILKQILEISENIEENIELFIENLNQEIKEKNPPLEKKEINESKNIHNLLDKIKNFSPSFQKRI